MAKEGQLDSGRAESGRAKSGRDEPSLAPSMVVGRILGNVTHELKTPLHSMLALAQLLEAETDGALNDEQHKQVQMIIRNGESLLELITQILTFSSLESGAQRAVFEEFAPAQIVRDLIQTLEPLAEKQLIQIDADIARISGSVVSDPRLVRQCLSNLLGNALKFSPPRTTLSIYGASLQDGSLLVEIADSGVGIPLELRGKIFEEFFQVENKDSRRYGGAGLGLALVRTALELLGGTIQVRSEVGQGSLFRVTIPSQTARQQTKLIFLAEADPTVALTISECLRNFGCRIERVSSPEAARAASCESAPALIVVGNQGSTPVADEVRRYRTAFDLEGYPVLALSAFDNPGERTEALAAGASDYLMKPFSADELVARVRSLLSRPTSEAGSL